MLETFEPLGVTFSGSDLRASEPGAPFGHSGTTGRSGAANASEAAANAQNVANEIGLIMGTKSGAELLLRFLRHGDLGRTDVFEFRRGGALDFALLAALRRDGA